MSDEELPNSQPDTTAPLPGEADVAEPVLELTAETATAMAPGPTDAALEELKTEVLSAVRGAITDVMSRHQPPLPEPDLDLDFSLKEPAEGSPAEISPSDVLEPVDTEQEAAADPDPPPNPIIAALTAPPDTIDAPIPAIDDVEPAIRVETAPPISIEWAGLASQVPALAEPGVLPVTILPPPVPAKGRLPAWTAAALLSMSGIAVGAGAAILLVDPSSTAEIRESLRHRLVALVPGLGEETATSPEKTLADGTPGTTPATEAVTTESEIAALDPPPTASEPAAVPLAIADPGPAKPAGPIGTRYSGAPVIGLAPVTPAPLPAGPPVQPDLVALARAVRVASAADAATLAHAFEPPVKLSITFEAARRVTSLDTLAALPAPASLAAPASSGTETGSSAINPIPDSKPPQTARAATAKPAKGKIAPPTGAEPTEPVAPLSAMARANEALRNGDVEKARMLLQSESEAGQVEAMLVLARSFDPSYLKRIGIAAEHGNAVTAEKLYRAWYEQSVKLGLVSEGVDLGRLIRAMARAKP